jgi:WD40 repeat protein/serine/threonine protein kinase
MNARDSDPRDDSVADWLEAYDEALAADLPPSAAPPSVSPEMLTRLEGLQSVLQRLHHDRQIADTWVQEIVPTIREDTQPIRSLGRFRILHELGRGGCGIVFLAWDPRLHRQVALKVPHPWALLTPDFRQRFVQEARAAAGLDHPNIVPVFETGEVGPVPYIASAYCPGPTLAAWLREQSAPVAVRDAASLVAQLADAMHYTHGRGILHRDLKPGNVMLVGGGAPSGDAQRSMQGITGGGTCNESALKIEDPERREVTPTTHHPPLTTHQPRITDFGLAKLLESDDNHTRSGAVLGTPRYMAPEQANGRLGAISPASDVYSLGAILYELLTGRPPFQEESDHATLLAMLSDEIVRPTCLRRDLPRDLETICLKCLEKQPERRYAGAGALLGDLRSFLAAEPILARPVSTLERLWRRARRHPLSATLFASTSLAAGGLLVGGAWHVRVLSREHAARMAMRVEADEAVEAERQAIRRTEELRRRRLVFARALPDAQRALQAGDPTRSFNLLDDLRPLAGQTDLRGFEWYYLRQKCLELGIVLSSDQGDTTAVAYSPDGQTLAWANAEGTICLADPDTGRVPTRFSAHRSKIRRIAFSPGRRTLASISDDGTVKTWDPATGEPRATLHGHTAPVVCMAFSPDGSTLATGSDDNVVILWDVARQRARARCIGHTGHVQAVAFAPDGKSLVSAAHRDDLRIWDAAIGTLHRTVGNSGHTAASLTYAPAGRLLFVADNANRVQVWNTTTWTPSFTLPGLDVQVRQVVFSPDGRTLAVTSAVGTGTDFVVRIWDVSSRKSWASFKYDREIWDLAFAPDSATLALVGPDGKLRLWQPARSVPPARQLTHSPSEAWSVAFSPDGKTAVSGGDRLPGVSDSLKFWDVASGKRIWSASRHDALVSCVAFSPDGKHVASGSYDRTVRLWDPATGKERLVLRGHKGDLRCLAFSPDGQLLASGDKGHLVCLWDVSTGRLLQELKGHDGEVRGAAFVSEGRNLVTAGGDKTVRVWDVTTGKQLRVFHDAAGICALAVSPDGRTAVSGNKSGQVKSWDLVSGEERVLRGQHQKEVWAVAYSPDGRTVASAGLDQIIRLWEPVTGYELLSLPGHEGQINSLAFSPGGDLLASASHDGTVKLWRAPAERRRER